MLNLNYETMKKQIRQLILLAAVFICFIEPDLKAQEYMRISQSDGTVIDIAIADIQKLTFDNLVSVPLQNQVVQQLLKMKLYPNPAREFVNIAYTLPTNGMVTLEIFTLNGNLLKTSNQGMQSAGDYNYHWQSTGIKPGTYLCIIKQNHEIVSEKVIIKK
jgi:hypothetical protein